MAIMHTNSVSTMQGLFLLYVLTCIGIAVYQMMKSQQADGKSSAKK